jgi:tetratricopeptide (TPR) repeat protein
VEPRARRHALREQLSIARAALDQGDRTTALQAIDEALAMDPEYLAALALKERILQDPLVVPSDPPSRVRPSLDPEAARSSANGRVHASGTDPRAVVGDDPMRADGTVIPGRTMTPSSPARPTQSAPVVSAEGWARFEYRARLRRIEKRAEAARVAIAKGRFAEARSVLDEIRDIDASHPELVSLSIELDAAEHLESQPPRWHWGPGVAAAVVFGGLLLGAQHYMAGPTREQASNTIASQKAAPTPPPAPASSAAAAPAAAVTEPAPLADRQAPVREAPAAPVLTPAVPPPLPSPRAGSELPSPVATLRDTPSATDSARRSAPAPAPVDMAERAPAAEPTPAVITTSPTLPAATSGSIDVPTQVSMPLPPPVQPALSPAVNPVALPGPTRSDSPDTPLARGPVGPPPLSNRPTSATAIAAPPRDEDLVRRALQQYRSAYENLDARSAQAVWPRVDEIALQRAFDGLASQRLTFDDCQVQVSGTFGSAQCRGSARYVPKVGSREPRVEPRVWTFGLRKTGDEWQIETARAER